MFKPHFSHYFSFLHFIFNIFHKSKPIRVTKRQGVLDEKLAEPKYGDQSSAERKNMLLRGWSEQNLSLADIQPSQFLGIKVYLEFVPSPTQGPTGPKTTIQLDNSPQMVDTKIRIESRMLNCTHLLECVPSPPQGPTGPKDKNQTW